MGESDAAGRGGHRHEAPEPGAEGADPRRPGVPAAPHGFPSGTPAEQPTASPADSGSPSGAPAGTAPGTPAGATDHASGRSPSGGSAVARPIVADHRTTRRAVFAAALGNATEWYDFGVYSYLAVVIGAVFYPAASPAVQLIATFTTFAAAFLVRPLGGLFFGPLGDRIGRKRVLAITMITMAVGTFAIGLIPSYGAIGITAPVLLLAARLVQGFSTGGEYGGATTFIAEYAPDRRRGFFASWLEFGTVSGYMAGALLVTVLTGVLDTADLHSWGWRIPFLLALPLGAVGLYLRLRLEETPVFTAAESFGEAGAHAGPAGERGSHRLRETVVGQWRPMLLCVGLVLVFNVNNYMTTSYMPTYLSAVLGYSPTHGLLMALAAMAAMLLTVALVGRLSDRVGRRPVLMSGSVCTVVLALPAFWLLQRDTYAGVLAGMLLLALTLVHFSGAAPAALPAFFPTRVRYGALAIAFNVSVALFGGTTPLVAEALVDATGNPYAPAAQLMLAGVIGIVAVSLMAESANRPLPGARATVSARDTDGAGPAGRGRPSG
ncbi:MHS family proline/betaine transporter-like MFS transporter [Streptomonospora nanhaiensis]|uniref:Putative proline/betaine transporter n=1 Tax=Streptomonospora nanhaiensis TaxID=1323731 RepID=A0A853BHE6_9ACTN|nr:MHS family proline/betaine transporter-like MFS transporter [Streptomonospora nanhaiensis]